MGLTAHSTGRGAVDEGLHIARTDKAERVIALCGNPNVGKSTVFNELTGMNQHTGNWPGKTVTSALGTSHFHGQDYSFVDLPGTYSLMAHSAEEEVARNFICFGGADAAVVVCDATCLERNLNLVLQTMEITPRVLVCVNLLDEAKKKQIHVDLKELERLLGVPVVGTSARDKKGLDILMERLSQIDSYPFSPKKIRYTQTVEKAIAMVEPVLAELCGETISSRWLALHLIDFDAALCKQASEFIGSDLLQNEALADALWDAKRLLDEADIPPQKLRDIIVSCIVLAAEEVGMDTVSFGKAKPGEFDRKLDRILTSKRTGIPIMLLLLCGVFWLTIEGANIPSSLLSAFFFWAETQLTAAFQFLGAPDWLHGALVLGVFRVLGWVVAVMLPPMAIFFPLFTLLEDFGYLPRVAFNLDHLFQKAHACGKQALTMCMGFGCNAAGVVGCRIIDSPRERLIAILTNNFVPCNGRFPTLIAIIAMFFTGMFTGPAQSVIQALLLTGVILLGVGLTFAVSALLSKTILKGVPSSFALELPPYRRPQIGKVLVRSLLDRTLFVLGRAAAVAAPAGLIIWIMANVSVGGMTLLSHTASFLDPFGRLIGMDGVIVLAFILGFPANEIVIPVMLMAYLANGTIIELDNLTALRAVLVENGWTWLTAICTMLFCLVHWPCSTTCLTIKKETGSIKWTLVSILLPTVIGLAVCFVFANTVRLLGLL